MTDLLRPMGVTRPQVRFLLNATACAFVAVVAFSFGLGGGFVLDDFPTLVDNDLLHVRDPDFDAWMHAVASFHAGHGSRPLAMLSFTVDYWLQGGLDPTGFKITNLIIHALTTLVLAFFLRHVFLVASWQPRKAAIAALSVTLLWAVHPLQVSSVLYIVQRMQTLVTLFVLLALWSYLALRQAQVEGRRGWQYGVLSALCGILALACKEDAVLLPAYMLVMELTVLGFRAASISRRRSLLQTFAVLAIVGAALYLFWVLPSYWVSESYAGRDFSSAERLLTQARVLVMYLVQILVPWPGLMPFHYDQLVVSSGLFDPMTTLPAVVLIGALLVWAWHWRARRPVFALGILLFLAGHFLTSNVIPLELAFEHRNHFALVGVLITITDLVLAAVANFRASSKTVMMVVGALLISVTAAGAIRAYFWGEPVRFAQYSTRVAPNSQRAWLTLGETWFNLAGRETGRRSPYMDQAIEAMEQGARNTGSVSAYFNIVIYRTIQGSVLPVHWEQLFQRLARDPLPPRVEGIVWTALASVRAGIGLDEAQVLRLIAEVFSRKNVEPEKYINVGSVILMSMQQQEGALPFFLHAARSLPPGDPSINALRQELVSAGFPAWADRIASINNSETDADGM